jgi:hypothetical protein
MGCLVCGVTAIQEDDPALIRQAITQAQDFREHRLKYPSADIAYHLQDMLVSLHRLASKPTPKDHGLIVYRAWAIGKLMVNSAGRDKDDWLALCATLYRILPTEDIQIVFYCPSAPAGAMAAAKAHEARLTEARDKELAAKYPQAKAQGADLPSIVHRRPEDLRGIGPFSYAVTAGGYRFNSAKDYADYFVKLLKARGIPMRDPASGSGEKTYPSLHFTVLTPTREGDFCSCGIATKTMPEHVGLYLEVAVDQQFDSPSRPGTKIVATTWRTLAGYSFSAAHADEIETRIEEIVAEFSTAYLAQNPK